ncbi:MAG: hypothetical protein ISR55_11775 [Bacteroidetes bacterium]|nr:hypothetical protein [Bacteroidota bacterium]MBL6964495.1 hypothetical protein [Bacteroidota bacterium]
MKAKLISFFLIALLLLLDWAAIHDILKGNEDSFMAEYMILIVSIVVFVMMLVIQLVRSRKK